MNTVQSEMRTEQRQIKPLGFDTALLLSDAAERGWTDAELARRARVSGTAIYRLRRGAARPSTLAKLAKALGEPLRRYLIAEVG